MYRLLLLFLTTVIAPLNGVCQQLDTIILDGELRLHFQPSLNHNINVNDRDRSVSGISDTVFDSGFESYVYEFVLLNITSTPKWQFQTGNPRDSVQLYIQYGNEILNKLEPSFGNRRDASSFKYFMIDFLEQNSSIVRFHIPASRRDTYKVELVRHFEQNTWSAMDASLTTISMFAVLVSIFFLFYSRDIIYIFAGLDFLGLLFNRLLSMSHTGYFETPQITINVAYFISIPAYFILQPLLLKQTWKNSFMLKVWVVCAPLLAPIYHIPFMNTEFGQQIQPYTIYTQHFITLLIVAGIIEQVWKRKKLDLYFTLLILQQLIWYLMVLPLGIFSFSESTYLILVSTPIVFTLIILSYRFTLTMKQRRGAKIALALAEQREFDRSVLRIQEEERKRIASDLHDQLASELSALKMFAYTMRESTNGERLIQLANNCVESVRLIAHNLMPPNFKETSLPVLINEHLELLSSNAKTKFEFICPSPLPEINDETKLTIYRIFLELVQNVIKHADASIAIIQILVFEGFIQLLCEDNGRGMGKKDDTQGLGLASVTSRVRYLTGTIHVDSSQTGTTVIINIPYTRLEAESKQS